MRHLSHTPHEFKKKNYSNFTFWLFPKKLYFPPKKKYLMTWL